MKKVLIVEPSRAFAEFAKLVLSRLGYQVLHVPDGETARYLLQGDPPDLLLTETSLPGMDGIELCRRVRGSSLGASIPVVALARNGSPLARQAALAAGCNEYLTKPVTARGLNELMQKYLPFSPRRRNLRARLAVTATVLGGETTEKLRTVSIGEGGLFLERREPHPEGTRLCIALPLPSLRSALTFNGVVAYSLFEPRGSLRAGMGVRFTDLDPNTSTLFSHYVENYVSGFLRGIPPEGARA